MVRPWNDPSIATMRVRPVRRVSLNAASLASVPELVKNTRLRSAPVTAASRSASRIWPSDAKKFDTCPSRPSWAATAAVTPAWLWPRALTARPDKRSR